MIDSNKYDAVCYTRDNATKARELCKRISDEDMLLRNKRWPWTRRQIAKVHGHAFDGFMMQPSWYAVACLQYGDYTWDVVSDGLQVGTLKEGCLARIAKDVEHDKAAESATLKALEERRDREEGDAELWEAKRQRIEEDYWAALSDLVGLRPGLPVSRIANAVAILKNVPDVRPLSEMLELAGQRPAEQVVWPEITKTDYDAYCDFIYGNLVKGDKVA
jgi:hypothetical protein